MDAATLQPLSGETSGYQIPKRRVPARVTLRSQPSREIGLYLCDRAERHSGPESPSDLLNGQKPFIPAADDHDRVMLLQRDAVMVLSVAADQEDGSADPDVVEWCATTQDVEVCLEDGTRLKGQVSYVRPEGQRRLQDFLNGEEMFIPLRVEDTVHLVNRQRILWATPL